MPTSTPRRWVDVDSIPAQPHPEASVNIPSGDSRRLDEALAISSTPSSMQFFSAAPEHVLVEDMPANTAVPAPVPPQLFLGSHDFPEPKRHSPLENHRNQSELLGDSILSTSIAEKVGDGAKKASWRSVDTEASTVTAENSRMQPNSSIITEGRDNAPEQKMSTSDGPLVLDEADSGANTGTSVCDKGICPVNEGDSRMYLSFWRVQPRCDMSVTQWFVLGFLSQVLGLLQTGPHIRILLPPIPEIFRRHDTCCLRRRARSACAGACWGDIVSSTGGFGSLPKIFAFL